MKLNNFEYDIISSSSKGNCLIFNKYMAIDMGVSYKQIKKHLKDLKVILLTHVHSDHFCKSTIKKIAFERPTIKFVCGEWLAEELVKLGVLKKNICIVEHNKAYNFGKFMLIPLETYHDVRNMSYRVDFLPTTIYYATDTNRLDYFECLRNLDYYFVEKNYDEGEIDRRIEEKTLNGEYVYETRVKNSHMSAEETNKFLEEMMGDNSKFIYCHQHTEKEDKNVCSEENIEEK